MPPKRPRGAAFSKGHDPRRHIPGKAPGVAQDVSGGSQVGAEPPADPGDLYAAMYAVLQPGVKPRTPLQRACKEWLRDKPSNFAERYEALQPKRVEVGPEKEKVLKDAATERCMEHLERLLARHREV